MERGDEGEWVTLPQAASAGRSFAGEMAEWLKAHAWKACLLERVTWVRIPLSPPVFQSVPDHDITLKIATGKRYSRRAALTDAADHL
jgi:hypothetical protein